jgi:small subunit ribosomal protein S17
MATNKKDESTETATETQETNDSAAAVQNDVETVEAAPAEEKPKRAHKSAAAHEGPDNSTADSAGSTEKKSGKRAERIGVVASDKMTKTVVVRVDRLVKHPIYRKYVRKRKKFMAHDEMGAKIGDKVRIMETRPRFVRYPGCR